MPRWSSWRRPLNQRIAMPVGSGAKIRSKSFKIHALLIQFQLSVKIINLPMCQDAPSTVSNCVGQLLHKPQWKWISIVGPKKWTCRYYRGTCSNDLPGKWKFLLEAIISGNGTFQGECCHSRWSWTSWDIESSMYPVFLFIVYKRVSVDLMKQLLAAFFGNPCSECLANEVCNRAHERHEESDRGSVSGEA